MVMDSFRIADPVVRYSGVAYFPDTVAGREAYGARSREVLRVPGDYFSFEGPNGELSVRMKTHVVGHFPSTDMKGTTLQSTNIMPVYGDETFTNQDVTALQDRLRSIKQRLGRGNVSPDAVDVLRLLKKGYEQTLVSLLSRRG